MNENRGRILTREAILEYLKPERPMERRLFVSPVFVEEQLGDTSVDLRIGHRFLVTEPSRLGELDLIHLRYENKGFPAGSYREVRVPFGQHFTLHPRKSVQVGTMEYIGLPNDLQGIVTLRASASDIPIIANSAQVHPGHRGVIKLTITSNADFSLRLSPGIRIVELRLQPVSEAIDSPRPSRYHSTTRPVPTAWHMDQDLEYLGPTVEPIIVGVTSTIAAGRTTAVSHLVERHGFSWFSLANILKNEAIKLGIPTLRTRMQELGTDLREIRGDEYLAARLRQGRKWQATKSMIVVVDSFKNTAEVEEFRKQKHFTLLGIDAPRTERWKRVKLRRRQGDPTTYEEFLEQDAVDRGLKEAPRSPHSQEVDKLLEIADKVLINDGEVSDFLDEVDRFVAEVLHPSR